MTAAIDEAPPVAAKSPLRLDLLRPAFFLLAIVLTILVVLPLGWLLYYSLVDKAGNPTLANFTALVTDATLRKPFLVAIAMALGVGALSCVIATPLAWLVSRTDLPGRRVVRALVAASFVTPPFLGAIAWEMDLPAGVSNAPMTYTAKGKQYIVVGISGRQYPGELVALALP